MKAARRVVLLLSIVASVTGLCNPDDPKERHCDRFPEKDVESVSTVVANEVEAAPTVEDPVDNSGGGSTGASDGGSDTSSSGGSGEDVKAPVTASSGSGGKNLGTVAIVAMSLGGVVLIAAAAVVQRRRRGNADDAVSGIDSSAMPASERV